MNNIVITEASAVDLEEILELLSTVELPHDGVAENIGAFLWREMKRRVLLPRLDWNGTEVRRC